MVVVVGTVVAVGTAVVDTGLVVVVLVELQGKLVAVVRSLVEVGMPFKLF